MWLYIEGQTDPIPGAERVPGEAVGDYWYNLETGATVFITTKRKDGETQETGRLYVWATTPNAQSAPVEVTRRFMDDDASYIESKSGTRNRDGKLKNAVEKLNEALGVE
ncbi:hypothetical protein [Microbacterium sp. 22296]|uniref:hypothetical protein n=1 Tax=Microbacterium sp. 22296 TaxID=3453903 RepID=UPI003F8771AB